jgi:superfamily I DNA/RNA helicase
MWVVPRTSLTEDQLHAVALPTDRHRIIIGGPGSGKTLVLAHRARQLLDEGVPPERLRLLVYTKLLTSYLRAGLADLGIPEECVDTVDGWTLEVHRLLVGGRPPLEQRPWGKPIPDYAAARRLVLDRIRTQQEDQGEDLEKPLDVILADEAQDLDEEGIALLTGLADHVTVALDARQQIWRDRIGLDEARSLLGVGRAQGALLSAYRCTPFIVELASAFLPEDEATRFRTSNLVPMQEREKLVLHTADSDAEQWDVVAKHLAARAILGQRTAVIVRTQKQLRRAVRELGARDIEVVGQKEADFADDRPIVMTYHSAKGLTVDAVLLPDLTADRYPIEDVRLDRNLMFVAVTRATSWVWMGTLADEALPSVEGFEVLDDLVARGVLVRSGGPLKSSEPSMTTPSPATDPAAGASLIDLL